MCWLIIAAIATLFFTWALWKSSNRRQDAARAEADLRVLKVEQTVGDSKKAAAEAMARAAEANKIAEQERLARLQLEARLAFRSIDPNAKVKISNALKPFAPQAYDILWYPDDQESTFFANEIFNILKNAGWTLEQSGGFLGFVLTEGVVIDLGEDTKNTFGPAVQELSEQLARNNIKVVIQTRPATDEEAKKKIRIRVGKKP